MFKSYQHLLYKDIHPTLVHTISIAAMINKSHPNQAIHNANNKRQIQNKTLVHTHTCSCHGGRVCFTFKHKTFLPLRKKKSKAHRSLSSLLCTEHQTDCSFSSLFCVLSLSILLFILVSGKASFGTCAYVINMLCLFLGYVCSLSSSLVVAQGNCPRDTY